MQDKARGNLKNRRNREICLDLPVCPHLDGLAGESGTAVVAVGNPLRQEDVGAISLLAGWFEAPDTPQCCPFVLDGNFAQLARIAAAHDRLIIIDSVLEPQPGGYCVLDLAPHLNLDRNPEAGRRFEIPASHAMSWLDELRLFRLSGGSLPETVLFAVDHRQGICETHSGLLDHLSSLVMEAAGKYSAKSRSE